MDIKILHLFPNLLSLYGEYGNFAILKKMLDSKGISYTAETSDDGNVDFSEFDFIYVGSGTEDNLIEAVKRLEGKKDAIKASIENNTFWLATGNAMTLFGSKIVRKDKEIIATETFDYVTEIKDETRFSGDVIAKENAMFCEKSIGYVNTSSVYTGITAPLFELIYGDKLGNDKASDKDGILVNNFYGTQFIGPVLVKNPHILKKVFASITKTELNIADDDYLSLAYKNALTELSNQM